MPVVDVVEMQFSGVGEPFRPVERRIDIEIGADEALVELRAATICGSDLHTCAGRRPAHLPSVLGHEGVGVVVAAGQGRHADHLGARVTWTLADSCGHCIACTDWDLPQKCSELFKYGHAALDDRHGLNGCFASHIVVRGGTTMVEVPDAISDPIAAPINCALATMVAVVERVPLSAKRVVIQGAGLLGIYGAALLRQRCDVEAFVVDVVPSRLDEIAAFGASPITPAVLATVADHTIDAVVEVAGTASVVPDGVRLLRPGGTYVFAGMVHPETELQLRGLDIVVGCLGIVGVHNYAPRHLVDAVRFLAANIGRFPWDRLISEPLPLRDLDAAFALAATQRWSRVAVSKGDSGNSRSAR